MGFGAGVMTAAAIWELIMPAMELGIVPAVLGVWCGMLIFLLPGRRLLKGALLLPLLFQPYGMGLLAGILLYAVVVRMIPRMGSGIGTIWFSVGFTLVMVLELV